MVVLALPILPELEDQGVQSLAHPPDRPILVREVGPLVQVIGSGENLLDFLKANSALPISSQLQALTLVEMKSHRGITVISLTDRSSLYS